MPKPVQYELSPVTVGRPCPTPKLKKKKKNISTSCHHSHSRWFSAASANNNNNNNNMPPKRNNTSPVDPNHRWKTTVLHSHHRTRSTKTASCQDEFRHTETWWEKLLFQPGVSWEDPSIRVYIICIYVYNRIYLHVFFGGGGGILKIHKHWNRLYLTHVLGQVSEPEVVVWPFLPSNWTLLMVGSLSWRRFYTPKIWFLMVFSRPKNEGFTWVKPWSLRFTSMIPWVLPIFPRHLHRDTAGQ